MGEALKESRVAAAPYPALSTAFSQAFRVAGRRQVMKSPGAYISK
ncbi:hypothetical protein ENTCAN_08457 [Enterobacter cancerogenus ATCC 35316]|nr:hypothetical protein ENTCAN_08457 [Enterobacter cancerogenus ATCC 35316]